MKDEMINYSVRLVKESTVIEQLQTDDTKIFKEVIVVCKLEEHFFENKLYTDILDYFRDVFPKQTYLNAYGEKVNNSVVAVIDYFEVLDFVEVNGYAEVYSRHFIEKADCTINDIVKKYYSDFTLMNDYN